MSDDYNEQITGTINFIFGYNKDIVPNKEINQLINEIITILNEEYSNLGLYFEKGEVENQKWFELNGLVQLAHDRRNQQLSPVRILTTYLTNGELYRLSVLGRQISEETSNERS